MKNEKDFAGPSGRRYYAVLKGRRSGIYTSWAEAQQQVLGFSDNNHKAFRTRSEAEAYIASGGRLGRPAAGEFVAVDRDEEQRGNIGRLYLPVVIQYLYNSVKYLS